MKKQYLLIIISLIISLVLNAQEPSGYYDTAEGKTTAQLKTALSDIITEGYVAKSYDFLYTIYKTSDRTPDGRVWDMYSRCTWHFGSSECGTYHSICDCYNREHSIPQSWFGKAEPMRTDAFHVYPTDGKVNGYRSNNPYGETNGKNIEENALGKLGACTFPGYTGKVFEPVDEYKGDFARTYFYFATRYENKMKTMKGASFNNTTYPSFSSWSQNLFLKWHRQDPVSQKEIDRNNAIYTYQKNRNPFIDHPELVEYIWGDKMGMPWTKNATNAPYIESPAINSIIDFGNIPSQQNSSLIITVKGAKLEGGLSLQLSGESASSFSLSTNFISKTDAENGYSLSISCNPQALGTLNAALVVSGGGITPTSYAITAVSSDSFMALAATNISKNSFTANWTSSAGANNYLLDVFSYEVKGKQSKTLLEEDFNATELPNGWTATGYYNLKDEASHIRMASGKKSCSLTTPIINLSDKSILTIKAKKYGSDNNATITILVNDEELTSITTEEDSKTFIIEIPANSSNSTITLSVKNKKRVFLDYVKVATEGATATPVSVSGYPKLVGNVLNYEVTGLQNDSTYFYTVTPQGNGATKSKEISVKTLKDQNTGVINNIEDELVLYSANKILYISNLNIGSKITILDIVGRKIFETKVTKEQFSLPLENSGIYILQVSKENRVIATKKLILK